MISGRRGIMKVSRGFTFIEMLASMFVVAIMVPLISIVFYQLMVTPPEQSARLTLANEVGIVASQLYADVYMSDNYSAGTYPYFGNFSWTDNSSGTNYLVSYYFNSSQNALVRQRTLNSTKENAVALSHHISSANFSLIKRPDNIEVIITANATTRMGKPVSHTVTLYITPRPVLSGPGRGGIWGVDAVVGTGSLTISNELNILNGDVRVDGLVSVTASDNRVTGDLYCDSLSTPGEGANFTYGNLSSPCPTPLALPNIGITQDYFGTNLSAGSQVLDDINHEYVFNASVSLTSVDQVWKNNNPSTHELKPGYYYSPETITLSDKSTRGSVTFIAKQIIIANTTNGGNKEDLYIGIKPFDARGLLLWATGSIGNDIWIKGSQGTWNPCVRIEGILFAPNGEIELAGTGSTVPSYSKAIISKGAIMAKYLTISGTGWWIYRW